MPSDATTTLYSNEAEEIEFIFKGENLSNSIVNELIETQPDLDGVSTTSIYDSSTNSIIVKIAADYTAQHGKSEFWIYSDYTLNDNYFINTIIVE